MNKREREALEAAGFRIGDAEDFLELTDEERRLVELRVERPSSPQRVEPQLLHGVEDPGVAPGVAHGVADRQRRDRQGG
jgi:hypothetical protein